MARERRTDRLNGVARRPPPNCAAADAVERSRFSKPPWPAWLILFRSVADVSCEWMCPVQNMSLVSSLSTTRPRCFRGHASWR